MANIKTQSENQEKAASQNTVDKLLSLIDKLAGNQSHIKFDVKDVKLNINGTRVTLNGEVNLNIVYSKEAET